MDKNNQNNKPIFEAYPLLRERIGAVNLGVFPTPVLEITTGCNRNNRLFVKRDDISGKLYGGNKVRKLEFLLADAQKQGANKVMTFGTVGSNHCLATTIYAKSLGLESIIMLTPQHNTYYLRGNILANLYYGADIHYFPTGEELKKREIEINEMHMEKNGRIPYRIPLGGSSPIGNLGFVNAAFELREQIDAGHIPEPDYLYIATGTLGTSAGLILGLRLLNMKTKVISVRINRELRVNYTDMLQQIRELYELIFDGDMSKFKDYQFEKAIHIEHSFFGDEYALFSKEGMEAIEWFKKNTGLLLDGTYTGKTMAAVLDDVNTKHEDKTILFWNSKNSVDMSNCSKIDYHLLSEPLQYYFVENVQPLDDDYRFLYTY